MSRNTPEMFHPRGARRAGDGAAGGEVLRRTPFSRAAARAPAARRTAKLGSKAAAKLAEPGPDAPAWARRAHRLAIALLHAVEAGESDASTQAAVERAYAAFELGYGDPQIARVAHVVERAHAAIRETQRRVLENAYYDAAGVLQKALDQILRRGVSFDQAVEVVRGLRMEANSRIAVADGVANLLGWVDMSRAHAVAAIRAAIAAAPVPAEDAPAEDA